MGLLGDIGSAVGNVATSAFDRLVDKDKSTQRSFNSAGFSTPAIPSADGTGLPSGKVTFAREHTGRRHIIHWFVPEVGVVNMYINPQSLQQSYKKLITQDRTKSGYVLQYWGEELPNLTIQGITGSSGVEGLNVLYEIYRAEQLTFDAVGLTMASNSSLSGVGDLANSLGNAIGGLSGDIAASATSGVFGLNPLTQSILPRNPPTLAALAFGVEMYYAGWVFRGYFTGMSWNESVQMLGTYDYTINFTVTQRRGYRLNDMAWHRSANSGPSNNGEGGVPLSYGARA